MRAVVFTIIAFSTTLKTTVFFMATFYDQNSNLSFKNQADNLALKFLEKVSEKTPK